MFLLKFYFLEWQQNFRPSYGRTESSSGSEWSILQGKWICGIVLLGSEHWDEFVTDPSAHNSGKNVLQDRKGLIFDIYSNKTLTKQKEEKRKSHPTCSDLENPKVFIGKKQLLCIFF